MLINEGMREIDTYLNLSKKIKTSILSAHPESFAAQHLNHRVVRSCPVVFYNLTSLPKVASFNEAH